MGTPGFSGEGDDVQFRAFGPRAESRQVEGRPERIGIMLPQM
jgi:hypothetical protein